MILSRVVISNFRNLAQIDIRLERATVIVGENRRGKSNLLHALRLVLDPDLSSSDRQLRPEDFWEGLSDGTATWDPMAAGESIEIAVEFEGIEQNDTLAMAALGDALIEGDPMRARLLYRFGPRDTATGGTTAYAWSVTGGVADQEIRGDVRRYLRQVHLHALRDVEGDIANWRRSPLRPLLDAAADEIDEDSLKELAETISEANSAVAELEPIAHLGNAISERLEDLVGTSQAPTTTLGVAPVEPKRLLRALRLYVEESRRPLSSSSLGSLNVLYLSLLELGLERQLKNQELAHLVLSIEEPEAHLHPHLQRLVFEDILRPAEEQERSVLVTSHSPHIVSVAPPKSLVILREGDSGITAAVAADANLGTEEWEDIERYLDATRGEIVFARKVLLVEGFAEQVLIPQLADDSEMDLDKEGITVCAIHGVHFESYCKYLSALGIPWSVVTDGDPKNGKSLGHRRAARLATALGHHEVDPSSLGIFVGQVSFEPDLADIPGNVPAMIEAFRSLGPSSASEARLNDWEKTGQISLEDLRLTLGGPRKGRFAQRLAATEHILTPPDHVAAALQWLTQI